MNDSRRQPSRGPSRLWPFKARDDIVTIVDLGSQKIACAIVRFAAPRFGLDAGARNIQVLGSACVRSSGFFAGQIVNMIAAETSIRRAAAQAESQAGITAGQVVVTAQFEGLATQLFEAKPQSGQTLILKEDTAVISAAVEENCLNTRRKLLHMFTPALDGDDIGGLESASPAKRVDVIAISVPLKSARQIVACFARSLLAVRAFIAGPVATALAVTDPLERTAGVLVIDMGAQMTGYALFSQGIPVIAGSVGLGGQHITDQIARSFALRKFEAERIKIRFGSVYDGLQADVDLPASNGETGDPISKFALNHLIRFNASQVFRAINEQLKGARYSVPLGGTVLAGGGSQLPGVRELASHLFASEVRTAKPLALNGLNAGSALAALAGGCLYASRHQSPGEMSCTPRFAFQNSSYASRIGQWLRASF
jgi:cell division protein FtsA